MVLQVDGKAAEARHVDDRARDREGREKEAADGEALKQAMAAETRGALELLAAEALEQRKSFKQVMHEHDETAR